MSATYTNDELRELATNGDEIAAELLTERFDR